MHVPVVWTWDGEAGWTNDSDVVFDPLRYSRAAKNQLRVYEKFEDGGVNHKAVVKEYSRSSADQASLTLYLEVIS